MRVPVWLVAVLLLMPFAVFGYMTLSYSPEDSPLPSAEAHPPASFTSGVAKARTYWTEQGVKTPCGKVDLVLVDRIPNPFVHDATGGAQKGICRILFTRRWFDENRDDSLIICPSVIHELGHVDGEDHSPDPRNIMYIAQSGRSIPGICR